MAKKLKIYNGSSWEDVTFAITPPNTAVTNAFTTNQVIDTSTSVAALRITQRGAGEALRVEDETSPDSTPFVINNAGLVGIGTTSPDSALHVAASGDTTINLTKTGQSTWYIQTLDAGTFRLYSGTANAERLRIDSAGNVIVGGQGINLTNGKIIINSTASVTGANWTEAMLHLTGINGPDSNPGITWHAPGASAISLWHTRGTQAIQIMGNGGGVDNTAGRMTIRNIAVSTAAPSGGADGDIWAVYTA